MAKPKTKAKAKAKAKPTAKTKAKAKPKTKLVAKAKAKVKAKVKAKPVKAKAKAKVKASAGKAKAVVKRAGKAVVQKAKAAVKAVTDVAKSVTSAPPMDDAWDAGESEAEPVAESEIESETDVGAEPGPASAAAPGLAPFKLIETEPGKHSLLLSVFEPASEVFEAAGLEGGGYAWEGVARYVTEVVAPELAEKFGLDPEASMFCAYGTDRAALEQLGKQLSTMFHNKSLLAAVIEEVGPSGFQD
jgi:hypothetical protein